MTRHAAWSLTCIAAALTFLVFTPPIAQDPAYHLFTDHRPLFGIPNFWNVVSNLPFLVVGILGLWRLRGLTDRVMFSGVFLTAFGSAYYHLAPGNARLVSDRLPMTIVFMSFFVVVGWLDRQPPPWFLAVALAAGVASVLWWRVTGDLRPYAVVKFGPLLYLLPLLFTLRHRLFLVVIAAFFALAQALELLDPYGMSFVTLSGHTWKHLTAGLATFALYLWRRRVAEVPA